MSTAETLASDPGDIILRMHDFFVRQLTISAQEEARKQNRVGSAKIPTDIASATPDDLRLLRRVEDAIPEEALSVGYNLSPTEKSITAQAGEFDNMIVERGEI